MAEDSGEQTDLKWSTVCRRIICVILFAFCLLLLFFLVLSIWSKSCTPNKTEDCSHSSNSIVAEICGAVSILLVLVGGSVIIACHKRLRKQSSTRVVVSVIPVEDLQKSPAPILPFNHIPDHPPFVGASSMDLPDYFTAVHNTREVSPYLNAKFWTENIDESELENPPPCYEQALKMSG